MVSTTVSWLKDRHFVGTDSNNHSVVLSGQKDRSWWSLLRGSKNMITET